MNRITKNMIISAAALLLLSTSICSVNTNAAKRHYRNHTVSLIKVRRHGKLRKVKRSRHNHKIVKREVNLIRHRSKKSRHVRSRVLKPRYQIVSGTRRGNRALRKSGFVDGRILTKLGYSNDFDRLIFNKYAPNDKRAKLPDYMNPKASRIQRRSPSYNNVNHDLWVKGTFELKNPKKNTRNPQVYKYYSKMHGWALAPRY